MLQRQAKEFEKEMTPRSGSNISPFRAGQSPNKSMIGSPPRRKGEDDTKSMTTMTKTFTMNQSGMWGANSSIYQPDAETIGGENGPNGGLIGELA